MSLLNLQSDITGGSEGAEAGGVADADEQEDEPHLSRSEAFDVLRNSRRRRAITCLREHGGPMTVNELSTCVATREYDVSPDELTSEQYKRVYTGLYQCHLDRAAEFGVLEFDSDDNVVRLRDCAAELDEFLDSDETPGSERVELGVAAATALLVVTGVGASGAGAVPTAVLPVLPLGALLGVTALQLRGR